MCVAVWFFVVVVAAAAAAVGFVKTLATITLMSLLEIFDVWVIGVCTRLAKLLGQRVLVKNNLVNSLRAYLLVIFLMKARMIKRKHTITLIPDYE